MWPVLIEIAPPPGERRERSACEPLVSHDQQLMREHASLQRRDGLVVTGRRQIHAEEDRTGVRDHKHFAYSTFAKSAALRRDNLHASIAELRLKLEAAQRDFDEANQQLARAATEQPREIARTRRRPDRPTGLALR